MWFVTADVKHAEQIHTLALAYMRDFEIPPELPMSVWDTQSKHAPASVTQYVIAVGTREPHEGRGRPNIWFCIPLVKAYKFGPARRVSYKHAISS